MVTVRNSWAAALLLLTGPSLPSGAGPSPSFASEGQAASLETARAERLEQRRLACLSERETLSLAIAAKKATCDAKMASFEQCRAERRDLEGAELWRCGLGLAMGVASNLASEPDELTDCGLAETPEARLSCSVPACTLDSVEIEREVLKEHGLRSMPNC